MLVMGAGGVLWFLMYIDSVNLSINMDLIIQVTNNYTTKRLCINRRVVTIENKQICIKWKVRVSAYRIRCVNARLSLSRSLPSLGVITAESIRISLYRSSLH